MAILRGTRAERRSETEVMKEVVEPEIGSPRTRAPGRGSPWVVRVTAVLGAALIVTAGFAALQPDAMRALSSTGCSYAPMALDWPARQETAWASAVPLPLATAAVLMAASYGNPEQSGSSLAAIQADLALLRSAGAQVIRIDLNYQPWLENDTGRIAEMDQVVSSVRADGLGLMIADSASESYRHHALPWPVFADAWLQRVSAMAARYHPDYYEVVKEPGWYYPMIEGYPLNPAIESVTAWTDLTQELISAVRAVSPHTQLGVAVAAASLYGRRASLSLAYLERARQLPGLDFLGFDVYGVCDFENTLRFLQEQGTGGKQVWIPEAWSAAGSGVYEPAQSALDVLWANVLYEFLARIRARGVALFYTDVLAAYEAPPQNASALVAYYSGRTPVFYTIQNLTAANRRLGFTVHVEALPSACGPLYVNGTGVASGANLSYPVREVSVRAPLCPGRSFQAWSTRGDVQVAAPTDPNSTLEVLGPGGLTALYASSPAVGVAVGILPDFCGASQVVIAGGSVSAGSGVSLAPGNYSLEPGPCGGLPRVVWRTTGNVSVSLGGTLLVRGPGALEAVYLPSPPPPELLSMPVDQAALVLGPLFAAIVGLPFLIAWDRRRTKGVRYDRPRDRRAAALPHGSKGQPWAVRWAQAGFVAQLVVGGLLVVLSLLLWSFGYVTGEAGSGFFLLGELLDVLVVLLLYLAWSRCVGPLRRGENAEARGAAFWLGVVELGAGFGVVGALYLLAYRSARRGTPPGLPSFT